MYAKKSLFKLRVGQNQGKGTTEAQHCSLTPSEVTCQSDKQCFKRRKKKKNSPPNSSVPEEYVWLSQRC